MNSKHNLARWVTWSVFLFLLKKCILKQQPEEEDTVCSRFNLWKWFWHYSDTVKHDILIPRRGKKLNFPEAEKKTSEVNEGKKQRGFKGGRVRQWKRRRERTSNWEREATRGTAVQGDHVEKGGRSMSRGRDETEQQKRGDKRARGKNVYRERKSRGENEHDVKRQWEERQHVEWCLAW